MPTPAENDRMLAQWIWDEIQASSYDAKVAAEQKGPVNLPAPAPNAGDVAAAAHFHRAASSDKQRFLILNGVLHRYARFALSSAAEFRRLLGVARKKNAPANVLAELERDAGLAVVQEASGSVPTGTVPNPSAPPSGTLSGLGMLAALTSPAWLALLYVRMRR